MADNVELLARRGEGAGGGEDGNAGIIEPVENGHGSSRLVVTRAAGPQPEADVARRRPRGKGGRGGCPLLTGLLAVGAQRGKTVWVRPLR